MLLKSATLKAIAEGRVTLAFRRWKRPTVKAGGTLQTPIGVLAIKSVEIVAQRDITRLAAQRAGFESREALLASLGNRDGQLYRIEFYRAGDDPRIALRQEDRLDAEDVTEIQTRLERLDARSASRPWTMAVLKLIASHSEIRAADLAELGGYDKVWLKSNIRKLKNLGLTESLKVGYQLSPRGRAFLTAVK